MTLLDSNSSSPAASILEQCIHKYEEFNSLNLNSYPLPNDHDYCVYMVLNMLRAMGRLNKTFLNKHVSYLAVYYSIADLIIYPPKSLQDSMQALKGHHQQWVDKCLSPSTNTQMEATRIYIKN